MSCTFRKIIFQIFYNGTNNIVVGIKINARFVFLPSFEKIPIFWKVFYNLHMYIYLSHTHITYFIHIYIYIYIHIYIIYIHNEQSYLTVKMVIVIFTMKRKKILLVSCLLGFCLIFLSFYFFILKGKYYKIAQSQQKKCKMLFV